MVNSASLLNLWTTNWISHPHPYFSVNVSNSPYKFHSKCKFPSTKSQFQFQTQTHFDSCVFRQISFPIRALKKKGKSDISLTDSEFDDEFDEFFVEDEDGEEDEEESMGFSLKKMNKVRGFGEGKKYDTAIEDNLLQEIEQSRVAQAANLNKLKNDSSNPSNSKNKPVQINAPEIINTGVRVRIVNLPKKKNIDRDLKMAFKEFPGIINITPAVVGNKKTRDPICKGFAFVDFKSEGDAIRFLQAFSRQNLTFGKIQKQIQCEMVDRSTSSSAHEISVTKTKDALPLISRDEYEQVSDLDIDDSSLELREETAVDNCNDIADETTSTGMEVIEENPASSTELLSDDGESAELRTEPEILSTSLKKLELDKIPELEEVPKKRLSVKGKKKVSKKKQFKEKGEKKAVIEIPGSSKRLKVKEKAVLSDVYSRYGMKPALVSKGGN